MNHKEQRNLQLGMNHSTASHRLRKDIMFILIQECNRDICYRCGDKIEHSSELSIEHKVNWFNSEDPSGLFFDLNNITFSHHKCNAGFNSRARKYHTEEERRRARLESYRLSKLRHYTPEKRRAQYLRTGN